MKQILILLSIFLFCSFISSAQKTISKEDFEFLVDYANSHYIMAFIEKNDINKPYYDDTYIKKVKPELEIVSLENFETIPDYRKISELLSNNGLALRLAETINERKNEYENVQSNEQLINELKATKWENVDLIPTAEIVLNSIFEKFNIEGGTTAQKKVQQQTIQTSTQVEELQTQFVQLQQKNEELSIESKLEDYQKSLLLFKLIVLGAAILIIGLIGILLFFLKTKSREFIIKHVLDSQRINEKFTSTSQRNYVLSENDIDTIVDRVLKLQLLNETEFEHSRELTKNLSNETSKPVYKYLKGKSSKVFNRAENNPDNSFFRLYNENDDFALFEFCGDEVEALAKRIFSEDVFTIVSGSYTNAHSIKTIKPGKIKRFGGDQWEVIEPIQIKFI